MSINRKGDVLYSQRGGRVFLPSTHITIESGRGIDNIRSFQISKTKSPASIPSARYPLTCREGLVDQKLEDEIHLTDRFIKQNEHSFESFVQSTTAKASPQSKNKQKFIISFPGDKRKQAKEISKPPPNKLEAASLTSLPKITFISGLFHFEDPISKKHFSGSLQWLIETFCDLFNEFTTDENCSEFSKKVKFEELVAIDDFVFKDVLLAIVSERQSALKSHINARILFFEVSRIVTEFQESQAKSSIDSQERNKENQPQIQVPRIPNMHFESLRIVKRHKSRFVLKSHRLTRLKDPAILFAMNFENMIDHPPFAAFVHSLYRCVYYLYDQRYAKLTERLNAGYTEIDQLNAHIRHLNQPKFRDRICSPDTELMAIVERLKPKFPTSALFTGTGDRLRLKYYATHAVDTESISLTKFFRHVQKFAAADGEMRTQLRTPHS